MLSYLIPWCSPVQLVETRLSSQTTWLQDKTLSPNQIKPMASVGPSLAHQQQCSRIRGECGGGLTLSAGAAAAQVEAAGAVEAAAVGAAAVLCSYGQMRAESCACSCGMQL